jgi:ABC-type glycerol-3-phosphate transport system substrate-binding protein
MSTHFYAGRAEFEWCGADGAEELPVPARCARWYFGCGLAVCIVYNLCFGEGAAMRLRLLTVALFWILAACAPQAVQPTSVPATESVETLAPPTFTSAPAATTEPTDAASKTTTLNIWWPEPLAPIDNQDAADLLSEQISAFQTANRDVLVEFRLKKAQDVGGIMSTLRAASLVAPGAMPDLTLLRRSDMLSAAQAGLIVPIDERAEAAILDNMHPMVSALGRVNDRLYGLPYNVDVQHIAYQDDLDAPARWSFAEVLEKRLAFVFPAGRANSLSDVFLAQYRDATGTRESNSLIVDADPLRALFQFYEQAVANKLVDPIVLEYILPDDYRGGLVQGSIPAGVVTSNLYLKMTASGASLSFASIPTQSGQPTTVVDGWMWVLTSSDAEEQVLALRFLNWMLDVDRQGRYNQAISMLPSQRTALRQWEDPSYATFVDALLNNATLPLSDTAGGATARVIQGALASVISGQRTAEQAAQDVVTQLAS